uniref:Uncharacterized protein n=1 Tax=Trichuris muris TaxID=70415 RepID=A0A5S6QIH0_TRIMR
MDVQEAFGDLASVCRIGVRIHCKAGGTQVYGATFPVPTNWFSERAWAKICVSKICRQNPAHYCSLAFRRHAWSTQGALAWKVRSGTKGAAGGATCDCHCPAWEPDIVGAARKGPKPKGRTGSGGEVSSPAAFPSVV